MDLQQKQACCKLELKVLDNDSLWDIKFDLSKKKKKKKKPLLREDITDDILFQKRRHFSEDKAPHCQSGQSFEPDYGYEELLGRMFDRLREEDVEVSTERPRTVMVSPQLLAQGSQKTVCLNFAHLCRTMQRKPDHVMKFLLGQTETIGLLNKQQQLVMEGVVSCKDFQAVFRRYIDAFVICSCCKNPDTALAEDNGLFTLRCEMCGLVGSIKAPNHL